MISVVPVALFVAFLWGLSPIIHKHILINVDPKVIMVVSAIFYTASVAIFSAYYWKFLSKEAQKLDLKTIILIAFTSIITAFLANLIYFYILKEHDSYIVSALIYSSPIFTLVLAYYLLKEKITFYGCIGVLFIVVGVVLISMNEKSHHMEEFGNVREV